LRKIFLDHPVHKGRHYITDKALLLSIVNLFILKDQLSLITKCPLERQTHDCLTALMVT